MSAHSVGALEPQPTDKSPSENHIAYPRLLNGSQTRIVHIQREYSSSNFVASLEVIDLDVDSRTTYDALSYHCGDTTQVSQVHFPDLHIYLSIGRNLTDALNRVLDDGTPGPFWIDAISINQFDIEERNQQVRLMTRIFSGARQVFAWLGPDDGTLFRALGLMFKWADPCRDLEMSMEMLENSMNNPQLDSPVEFVARLGQETTGEEWAILKAFWDRPYFRRAWIVQEMTVARKLCFLCGALPTFGFGDLLPSVWWLGYHMARVMLDDEHKVTNSTSVQKVLYLYRMRRSFGRHGAVPHFLFEEAWQNDSTDPRDKFFATQGIFDFPKDIRHHFEVDYGRPLWVVYAEAARGMIKASRSLFALTITNILASPDSSFPSWVPRFDGIAHRFMSHPVRDAWTPDLNKLPGVPHASPGTEPRLRETGQPCVLSLLGMKQTCAIADVMSLCPEGFMQGLTDPSRVWALTTWPAARIFATLCRLAHLTSDKRQIAQDFAECTTMKYHYPRELHQDSPDSRTIIADFRAYLQVYLHFILTDAAARNVSHKLADELRDVLEELNRAEDEAAACLDHDSDGQQLPRGDPTRYCYAMAKTCINKNFFVTKDSKIGIGPAETKQGDGIVVLYGAATPFVIRRNEPCERWHLIGSADWVQGMMDGEVMKDDQKEEAWFDLRAADESTFEKRNTGT
ncbi:hypothetical protein LTR10_023408 [Elasticomyces elasticus]|uniref:Heterokaryon incompatibility domain-containing protein n=1 Tax=Exophiala sideris TaxID=1016849 RepID=A0ABR0JKP2_9EURO|nr:hypothetical protein LTR10_023408 [Elasticomyces elasticus]KAK5035303.1 hypothetical protein LTS07_002739 [Exophiala sideris]KAK5039346.1 hypothetical protein LTR13_003603 [Exophiala sideris]KAK5066227.1 hypothetical protein LTR69_002745 [Exophiala sideris]KAK5186904.1 hypothetical protein LTR44_000910 [Eurotiomycetes sp. CCFEE 6388]